MFMSKGLILRIYKRGGPRPSKGGQGSVPLEPEDLAKTRTEIPVSINPKKRIWVPVHKAG